MKFYLAPMEGLTGFVFRNAYQKHFGNIDTYFTPFINNKKMNYKEIKDILPEHNEGMHVVPQILTNRAEDFLAIAKELGNYGYESVNLNLGCPSGTVVAKHRGAGFLAVPEELDHFLEEIFAECPLRISVKTRVGVNDAGEWEHLLSIYEKFPMEELISTVSKYPTLKSMISISTATAASASAWLWRTMPGTSADLRSLENLLAITARISK